MKSYNHLFGADAIRSSIRAAMKNPMTSSDGLNPYAILDQVLNGLGLTSDEVGGRIRFLGKDPILKSPWPLATMGGVAMMAKAVAAAAVWRHRTGEGQDISLDLRKVPHRLCPFYDRKWELINGIPPGSPSDPTNPFKPNYKYPTKDGRWILLCNMYPKAKTRALSFLGCPDNVQAITDVTRRWNAFELEEAANRHGLQATVIRTVEEFLALEQFDHAANEPLVEIEKIGQSAPVPFAPGAESPLDGIRGLGIARVIAGPGLGRAMALQGADVLNIWRPEDFETDTVYSTSSVGMRSATVDFGKSTGLADLKALISQADAFFANRRPGYLAGFGLTASELALLRPGIVHVEMSLYGPTGPWSGRIGYDQNAGAVSGIFIEEGTFDNPSLTEIFVVNDYAMAWLSFAAVCAALKRRSIEGGSYRIRISLTRLSIWLMCLGMFEKGYAHRVGHSPGGHEFLPPDTFTASTPMGHY